MSMLIGYARVSTNDQDTSLQLDALRGTGCERIYEEKAGGAAGKLRPELDRCLDALRDGDTLVVWRLDRLGRSLKELVAIISDLQESGVGFRSITEALDTTSTGGRLVFHIFAALAEFERSLIQERTRAGLSAARARGRQGGRRPKLSNKDAQKALAMLTDPCITKAEVAAHFGVTRPTLNAAIAKLGAS
ncbi:TPA: recombinase family protein [Pseudomonas aeruginosa]